MSDLILECLAGPAVVLLVIMLTVSKTGRQAALDLQRSLGELLPGSADRASCVKGLLLPETLWTWLVYDSARSVYGVASWKQSLDDGKQHLRV